MPEWWTYGLSDFLLFSPRTYYRLLERHNAALWPAQLVTLVLGLGIIGLVLRPARWSGRAIAAILALLWAWVGWVFFWERYASINWAAAYFGWLFGIQAVMLVWVGVVRDSLRPAWRSGAAGYVGGTLLALSIVLYPALGPVLGRSWSQAEVFGITPDPTALGTLGLLLVGEGRERWLLLPATGLWCLIGAATLWGLHQP
jgi:Family of unknown function (DUF6064)